MSVYAKRRKRVREWLDANPTDAMLVTSRPNLRYLFGFGGEGLAVIGGHNVLCTDRRYELEAQAVAGRVRINLHDDGHAAGAAEYLRESKAKRVAFEADTTTYSTYEGLGRQLGGVELVPSQKVIEGFRIVKDSTEIALISAAADIMDRALADVIPQLRPGCTEREFALELDRAALTKGAEAIAFDTIVAFGPSAASPHAAPGDRRLESGQMVKIDCGANADGYCSDITRTYMVGDPDEQLIAVYTAVHDAQKAAVEAARPGMKCAELDAVARDIITDRGFGDEFSHSLGHGVGLEVHEGPRLSRQSKDTLRPGMVVTVEPGVYIKGWGGVRIEDTVVVTRSGVDVLTRSPKQDPPR